MKTPRFRIWLVALLSAFLCITPLLTPQTQAQSITYTPPSTPRTDLVLNGTWKFYKGNPSNAQSPTFNDSSWSSVTLPHTWNSKDGQDGGNNYYRGSGWYRLHYTVPSTYSGRRFFLQFDGANLVTDAWVNGTSVGQHKGGFAAFRFDATSAIKVGVDNVIAVKVNNAYNADIPPLSGDFTQFGGLYRQVHLLITHKLQVRTSDYGSSGMYLTQSNVSASSADLEIKTKVYNGLTSSKNVTIKTTIAEADNTTVQTLTTSQSVAAADSAVIAQQATIPNPHLWNGRDDPYMYRVYVEVRDGSTVTDLVSQPLGIRWFSVDANNGFFLNGKHLSLHGVSRHQDRLDKGWAISDADQEQDMRLIKEIGANAIRLAHYQHAQKFYDLTDQNGMIVWAEIPLIDKVTPSTAFSDNAKQQLIELIRQNYNHPSIAFWGIANEVDRPSRPDYSDPNAVLAMLADVVDAEDPARISTIAQCATSSCNSDTAPSTMHTETVGYNRYYGWYGGASTNFAGWADTLHANNPSLKMSVSEFGAGASVRQHIDNPAQPVCSGTFHPEEYQNQFHEAYWKAMETRPYLWGTFVWNMFDFASDERAEGDTNGRNDKGLVTFDRQTKKDAFFWYKANWTDDPFVYITSRRFSYRSSPQTDIKVYANVDRVELLLNGQSLGSQTSNDHIFLWPAVTLQVGSNMIEAIGTRDGTTYRDSVSWRMLPATRIDVGNPEPYMDASGRLYLADVGASGGTVKATTHSIGGTSEDALYQTYRYGTFSYAVKLANDSYKVYVNFVEPALTSSGARVFSVKAEGATKLSNIDIFKEKGQYNALEKSFTVSVNDGTLNLEFIPTQNNAIVSAIAITKVTSTTTLEFDEALPETEPTQAPVDGAPVEEPQIEPDIAEPPAYPAPVDELSE